MEPSPWFLTDAGRRAAKGLVAQALDPAAPVGGGDTEADEE